MPDIIKISLGRQKLTQSHPLTKDSYPCTQLKEHKLDSKDLILELKWKI
jgi:hypothetical protein